MDSGKEPVDQRAIVKLLGSLCRKPDGSRVQCERVEAPTELSTLAARLASKHGVELRSESVLVVVNGVESGALQGMKTVIKAGDEVVFIPMFHGGRV
jgi:molybdopterin converting factor small subunit